MIDTHIHLDSARYTDRAAVCKGSARRGVEAIVVPGINQNSNLAVLKLVSDFPGLVYGAAGLHPELPSIDRSDIETMADTLRRHRASICAVGEVGIPYYGPSAANAQRQALARELLERAASLACELDLAIILHAPHETAAVALQIVRGAGVRRAVFHWHKSDRATTRAILDAGFFVSLTPEVVWRERDRELARFAPLEQMVVETDGPHPYERVFPSLQTEPWMVSEAVAAIAAIKRLGREAVAIATSANARKLFALERPICKKERHDGESNSSG
ncbi:MAG TPA: TatD family hydrolase [Candidatus Binataceae bacterium]|nr:TatD family hydrolase [Candidatus Binataceae bacterium]